MKVRTIPTNQQMIDEFSLPQTTVNWLKKKGTDGFAKLQVYREAWLYRVICSFMPTKYKESFQKSIPAQAQLLKEFGDFTRYVHDYESNRDLILLLHIDAWNLRHVVFSKLIGKRVVKINKTEEFNVSFLDCSLKFIAKDVPSNNQIIYEFGLANSTIYGIKNNGEKGLMKLNLYREAWLYRTILSFMSEEQREKIKVTIPNALLLADEFGKTRQNYDEHYKNNTKMYDIYVDVWNLRHVLFVKLASLKVSKNKPKGASDEK